MRFRMPTKKPEFWMSSGYATRPISEEQIDLAYVLIEASRTDVKRDDWRAYCNRIVKWRGATGLHDDVFVSTDRQGHIRGLFVTEVVQSLLFGRVLEIPLFVSASAGDEDGIIEDLLQAATAKAEAAGCGDIRIWTPGGESWSRIAERWASSMRYSGVQISLA